MVTRARQRRVLFSERRIFSTKVGGDVVGEGLLWVGCWLVSGCLERSWLGNRGVVEEALLVWIGDEDCRGCIVKLRLGFGSVPD